MLQPGLSTSNVRGLSWAVEEADRSHIHEVTRWGAMNKEWVGRTKGAQPKRQQKAGALEVARAGHGTMTSIQAGRLTHTDACSGRVPSPLPGFHLFERRIPKYGQEQLQ